MTQLEINPTLKRHKLVRLLGGRKSSSFSRSVSLKVERLKTVLQQQIKPKLYYLYREIEPINASVNLGKGQALKSPKLSRVLKDCNEIVCFVATIGDNIEDEIRRLLNKKSLSGAYILDAMGSLAVESIVEKFYQRMMAKCQTEDKGVTLRFSPGYCDWPITDQKKIFSLFDSFQLGVKLTDSCLMQPRKSISGVFGILPYNMNHSGANYNPCSDCTKKDCIARREGNPEFHT